MVGDNILMFNMFINSFVEWLQSIFPHNKTMELKTPVLGDEIEHFIAQMKCLLWGNHEWSNATSRYGSISSPFVENTIFQKMLIILLPMILSFTHPSINKLIGHYQKVNKTIISGIFKMSFSLDSFYIPNEWKISGEFVNDYKEEVLNELIRFKIIERNNDKNKEWVQEFINIVPYFWSDLTYKQRILAGHLMCSFFIIDDPLDSNKLNDNEVIDLIERYEFIFIEGKFKKCDQLPLENFLLFFRNKCLEMVGDNILMFNMFINSFVEWLQSIFPHNKTLDPKMPVHWSIQSYFRKINIGIYAVMGFNYILFPNKKINITTWTNPRYNRMIGCIGKALHFTNDAASYCKEMNEGGGLSNVLFILQVYDGKRISFEEAFEKMVKISREFIDDFLHTEKEFKNSLPQDQRDEIEHFIALMKSILWGSHEWSKATSRYGSISSPFIENTINIPT
ncbi:hypothetical protein ACTA71_010534 [Dictyostelium dimigraforme]